jgi:hypothetical protein
MDHPAKKLLLSVGRAVWRENQFAGNRNWRAKEINALRREASVWFWYTLRSGGFA